MIRPRSCSIFIYLCCVNPFIKIRMFFLLIPLYLSLTGMYRDQAILPVFNQADCSSNIPSGKHSFFSTSSLFNAIPENQVNGNSQVPAPSLKNHTNDYTAHPRTTSLLFFHLVTGYVFFSEQIAPGFPKTRIAFPFSYFW